MSASTATSPATTSVTPTAPPTAAGVTIPILLNGGASRVQIGGQFPISEDAWDQLMAILGAMKPGLVKSGE